MTDPSQQKTALVTGAAGFIGYFMARALLGAGWRVVGIDALSDYYEVSLKERRRDMLLEDPGFDFVHERIETLGILNGLFKEHRFDAVVHLAAQAGVRHSINAPDDYVAANIRGTFELLEAARARPPAHMLLASSSSVYGGNTDMPYAETHKTDLQMSFYGATKKATETFAQSYAHLYRLPVTMFRFFTVYGPWGRPDMAHFKFTKAILKGEPIEVYNNGQMMRDFTYIDDLIRALMDLVDAVPGNTPVNGDSLSPLGPFRIVNIGNGAPVKLLDFIGAIEAACGREAEMIMRPMQPGDVPATWADTTLLDALVGPRHATPLPIGIQAFVDWYRDYYKV
ncbi:MAG: NAD-dependent epimerase/dehydratase family protein [Pseudomonadota bacterium]